MEYTAEQIEEWKAKAQKWDTLGDKIAECYPEEEFDDHGNLIENEDEGGDLGVIGEYAAMAYGWL